MEKTIELTGSADGVVSGSLDVSAVPNFNDWLLRLTLSGTAKAAMVEIHESVDNFATYRTLLVANPAGVSSPVEYTAKSYTLPSARIGVLNAKLRLVAQAVTQGSISARLSLTY
jgi:hypothetical protein